MLLKIFRSDTYPDALTKIRKDLHLHEDDVISNPRSNVHLRDHLINILWKPSHPTGMLIGRISSILAELNIVVFHNTRLSSCMSVIQNGLIFADQRYIDNLRCTYLCHDIPPVIIDEIVQAVVNEQEWRLDDHQSQRGNQICFIYDYDYYYEYDKFLAFFGGEFVEFGLSIDKGRIPLKYKRAVTIGKPYVIEFFIPGDWFPDYERKLMAARMLEKWVNVDVRGVPSDHRYDGHIDQEIPPENIIKMHIVEDNFQEIYECVFSES